MTQNYYFLLFVVLNFLCACDDAPTYVGICVEFGESEKYAKIDDAVVSESSGLAISSKHEDLLWTHNDSGGKAQIFALSTKGADRGILSFGVAEAYDWEAMSLGPCNSTSCLFVGDIGDNGALRDSVILWRLEEPEPPGEGRTMIVSPKSVEVVYPDGAKDSEAMVVDTETGDVILIEKSLSAEANVYRLPSERWEDGTEEPIELELIGTIDFLVDSLTGGMITGADMAPAGHEIFARTYIAGFHIPITRGQTRSISGFGEPRLVDVFDDGQCESVAYAPDGLALWFTCEEENAPIAKADCETIEEVSGNLVTVEESSGCAALGAPQWLGLLALALLRRRRISRNSVARHC